MNKARLQYLLHRYGENKATPSEQEELAEFLKHSEEDTSFSEVLEEELKHASIENLGDLRIYEALADQVLAQTKYRGIEPVRNPIHRQAWFKWAAAACVLLLAAASIYLKQQSSPATPIIAKKETPIQPIILPGKNGAILTLADGSNIVLDSLGNGKISSQRGVDIVMQNGKLAYTNRATETHSTVEYNTLSTPKGRQYQIRLDDGTDVWLNAASSIRYPAIFNGTERVVEVTGEAYFEVAKDRTRPFKVKLNQTAEIVVLGTHFNVNAYSNEPAVTTTLLEGSIRFRVHADGAGKKEKLLRPGEQTTLDNQSLDLTATNNVETAQVIAWKNGVFDFNGANLRAVMQQLERWYDIEVAYQKKTPDIRFFGKMTKNLTLNDLLVILEKSNVHFKIEGRKITVMP